MQLDYFDGHGRVKFPQAFFCLNDIRFNSLQDPVFIAGFLLAPVLWVPEMKHLSGHETVFSLDSKMAKTQHQVRVFMTPSLKGFVKPIDTDEVGTPDTEVTAANATPFKVLFYPE